jgi:hypothetical protein
MQIYGGSSGKAPYIYLKLIEVQCKFHATFTLLSRATACTGNQNLVREPAASKLFTLSPPNVYGALICDYTNSLLSDLFLSTRYS